MAPHRVDQVSDVSDEYLTDFDIKSAFIVAINQLYIYMMKFGKRSNKAVAHHRCLQSRSPPHPPICLSRSRFVFCSFLAPFNHGAHLLLCLHFRFCRSSHRWLFRHPHHHGFDKPDDQYTTQPCFLIHPSRSTKHFNNYDLWCHDGYKYYPPCRNHIY